jgi:hypothetical protein
MIDPHVSAIIVMKYNKSQRNGRGGGEVMGEMKVIPQKKGWYEGGGEVVDPVTTG